MEIIIALVIIGVGLIWYFNAKKKDEANLPTAEPVKPTVNAADLAQPLVITPSPNPMQSMPVTVATEPVKEPAVETVIPAKKPRVGKKAAASAKAADKASKAKPAAKKTPARKSGGKKVG